ncbi:hypothetical protein MHU86_10098 [Fragilaria crotonensis]|nr:hypothetical protein MHU86_10098 [Fragilaria crotonensis]
MCSLILPTDIMLGRGPTCYNNPGNRVFRKLVKEHVEHYKNEARRREKAALVKMLISKLRAKGYRFLHRSATGTWIDAPPHIVEKKVGHGLRDARLSASKIGGDIKVLPKNFRPAIAEPKHTVQAEVVVSGEIMTAEEIQGKRSDNTAVITTGEASNCDTTSTKLQENLKHVVDSSPVSPLNLPCDFASIPLELPLADGRRQNAGLSSFFAETYTNSSSEMEQRLENCERSWDDIKDTLRLPDVSPRAVATHGAHDLDAVGMVMNMYAGVYGQNFDNYIVDDPYQPFGCDLEDAQSLCRWFSHLL